MPIAKQRLHFIGVSTGASSIMKLFPRWAEILGLDAEIVGRDIALGAEPLAYRAAVAEILREESIRGALVTTHKVDAYRHAADLFDELDRYARLCQEISCISKRGKKLVGHAKDPITAGLTLEQMVGSNYWQTSTGQVLILGAGGAGTAITVRLLSDGYSPDRIVVVDKAATRTQNTRSIVEAVDRRTRVECLTTSDPRANDALIESLPPASLVVNATGMGKDLPGSPITDAARFPENGIVWDLNYRGELEFLRQASRQKTVRHLQIHDGWQYFLHGWTAVIEEVFQVGITPERFAELARAAEPFRPSVAA